jgi:hypothetical protein
MLVLINKPPASMVNVSKLGANINILVYGLYLLSIVIVLLVCTVYEKMHERELIDAPIARPAFRQNSLSQDHLFNKKKKKNVRA